MDERDDIAAYIKTLSTDKGMNEAAIREGYEQDVGDVDMFAGGRPLRVCTHALQLDSLSFKAYLEN